MKVTPPNAKTAKRLVTLTAMQAHWLKHARVARVAGHEWFTAWPSEPLRTLERHGLVERNPDSIEVGQRTQWRITAKGMGSP